MKKRLSINNAREIRNEEIKRLDGINPFVVPVKGVDSGAYGKKVELEFALPNSRKTEVASEHLFDGWFNYENLEGKTSRRTAEVKTNGGRLQNLLDLKDSRHVAYKLKMFNSRIQEERPLFICTKGHFVEMLKNANSIRTNGYDRQGKPIPSLLQVKKSFIKEIDKYLAEYPNAIYKHKGQVIKANDIL